MGIKLEITKGEKQTRMPSAYSRPALEAQLGMHDNNIRALMDSIKNEQKKKAEIQKLLQDMQKVYAEG